MVNSSGSEEAKPGAVTARAALIFGLAGPCLAILGAYLSARQAIAPLLGFRFFGLGLVFAVFAALAATVGLTRARNGRNPSARRQGLAGLTLAVATISAMVGLALPTVGFPLINDISTDVDNPPAFVKSATLVENQGRDMSYPDAFRSEQRRGYPHLTGRELDVPADEAFSKAQRALEALPNTQIIDLDSQGGRIEAISTSRVFHFIDDIVVRIESRGEGSYVDVRSKSRDGKGDMGVNAQRIEAIFLALQ